jgi:2'-5' RNA ligase
LHNTLVFLGNVAENRLEALVLAAQETAGTAFNLCFDEVRYWRHNHIVYAAPGRIPAQLTQLVQSLEQHLRRHHFSFDQREYKPHVTLLRHANWDGVPLPGMRAFAWAVHDFVLVQSLSDENGARYQVLARFPLRES